MHLSDRNLSRRFLMAIACVVLLAGVLVAWGSLVHAQATSTTITATTTSTAANANPLCDLYLDPSRVQRGQSATLAWGSSNALTGSIDQGLGTIASVASGSMTVSPTTSTTYTATFVGSTGTVRCRATLTVDLGGAGTATDSLISTSSQASTQTGTTTANMTSILPPTTSNYYYGAVPGGSSLAPTSTYYSTIPANQGASTNNAATVTPTGTSTSAAAAGAGTIGTSNLPISSLTGYPTAGSTPAPMVVDVDSAGSALVRGVVISAGANSIAIQSWGGLWIVRTNSAATVIPAGSVAGALSSISVGDFVGVEGTLATDQLYTIDANLVRDWTTHPYTGASTAASAASGAAGNEGTDTTGSTTPGGARTGISSTTSVGTSELYTGTVSDVGTESFTLTTSSGSTYIVSIGTSTSLWDLNGNDILFSSVQPGDMARLNGTLDSASGVITASVVRDTSITGAMNTDTNAGTSTGTSTMPGTTPSSSSDSVTIPAGASTTTQENGTASSSGAFF